MLVLQLWLQRVVKKESNKRRHGIKAEEQDNLTSSSAETEPATQLTKSHTCILKCSRNDCSIYTFSTHNTFSSLVLLTYIAECLILNRATSILVETSKQDHIKQVVFIFKTSICSQSGKQGTSCTASQKQKWCLPPRGISFSSWWLSRMPIDTLSIKYYKSETRGCGQALMYISLSRWDVMVKTVGITKQEGRWKTV